MCGDVTVELWDNFLEGPKAKTKYFYILKWDTGPSLQEMIRVYIIRSVALMIKNLQEGERERGGETGRQIKRESQTEEARNREEWREREGI